MSPKRNHPESCITLSPAILDYMERMSVGPLKVYIHLCACFKGHPFSATISQLKAATRLEKRSIVAALKLLREWKLITRISGSGNQPNQYIIPLVLPVATRTDDTTSPGQGLIQATPLTATPPLAPILELIAACYRPINALEFIQLKQTYPDEVSLREKLERLKSNGGGVESEMQVGFFIQALKQFAYPIVK
jgi:hypothetical protein